MLDRPILLFLLKEFDNMSKNVKVSTPRYQQIAVDIASKIISGHYQMGDKIYTRSSLSSQYDVSSETARRAINILSDLEIVEVLQGSGVIIKSCEKAIKFVKQHTDIHTVNDLKRDILNSLERQINEKKHLTELLNKLIDKTNYLKSTNPFIPFEISIANRCPFLGKTISEVNFWHNTLATIIGIKRENKLMMSPGPYAVFTEGDVLYLVGDENCLERVTQYLYP